MTLNDLCHVWGSKQQFFVRKIQRAFFTNVWMLGICIGISITAPQTGFETQVTCLFTYVCLRWTFFVGYTFLCSASGARWQPPLLRHTQIICSFYFYPCLRSSPGSSGAGLAHLERVLILHACHIVSTVFPFFECICPAATLPVHTCELVSSSVAAGYTV